MHNIQKQINTAAGSWMSNKTYAKINIKITYLHRPLYNVDEILQNTIAYW